MTADTAESALSGPSDRVRERDAQSAAREQIAKLADLAARVEVQLARMTEAAAACTTLLTELAQAVSVGIDVEEVPGPSAMRSSAGDRKFGIDLVGASAGLMASFKPGAIPASSRGIGGFPDDIGKVLAELGPNAGLLGFAPFDLAGVSVAHSALAELLVRFNWLLATTPDTVPTSADGRIGEPDDFGERLTEGFAAAVKAAVRDAHAQGFAVPGRRNGVAVEVRPDGTTAPIDETVEWTPTAWRTRAPG
jgi:hypothetical protein